jgi:hypothetical protein
MMSINFVSRFNVGKSSTIKALLNQECLMAIGLPNLQWSTEVHRLLLHPASCLMQSILIIHSKEGNVSTSVCFVVHRLLLHPANRSIHKHACLVQLFESMIIPPSPPPLDYNAF